MALYGSGTSFSLEFVFLCLLYALFLLTNDHNVFSGFFLLIILCEAQK